jgi:hypothetical protein
MKQFFFQLRIYRKSDQHYWTLHCKTVASDFATVTLQIAAFEAGLLIAGAHETVVEAIYADFPLGTVPASDYRQLNNQILINDLQVFLGIKRDRRKKELQEDPPVNSENGNPDVTS